MQPGEIADLFAPFGAVDVKRMFGAHGVYADGICFALEVRGEIFLKVDDETVETFRAAGSRPFSYQRGAKFAVLPYWLLAEAAFDAEAELRHWSRLALEAARRVAVRRAAKPKSSAKPKSGAKLSPAAKPKRATPALKPKAARTREEKAG